ncbi:putative lipid II flippase MurJ [Paenibacillus glycanilyticus]|uniref:Lipid II flippase MurJ n=1 Tax=Paenibacillus glycanilyticus TaxID=126569 RepID=A0ABQ6NQ58_9BACL|nr:murein biosynthesis integral membrane protein MurJ [Paenibacillus glycanilyticus]GMK46703.1 putative lipid II flippase MurJ [Paenibacillus glycanilyticus]
MNAKVIVSGAIILFVGNMLSSLLGLSREVLLAAQYGTGMDMDSYLFANTIPAIILSFMSGIFSSGFIPLYIKHRVDYGAEKASLLYSNTINWMLLLLAVVAVNCYVFSPYLSELFAPNKEAQAQIMHLLWILIPTLFFFTLSYAQSMVLNSVNHFLLPALLTLFNNIVMIVFIVFLHNTLGIYSVAWGYLIGTVIQVLVQLPIMRKKKLRYRFYINWKDETIRRLLAMSIPIAGLVVIDQCTVLATRYFAANLAEGSASALNFANRIVMLPVSLFGTAIISSTFPSAVQMFSENKFKEYERLITTTVKSIVLVLVPVMVLCGAFAKYIIRALLERGAFDANATQMTSFAFILAAVGILLYPIRDFFVKLLISRNSMRTPILSSVLYAFVFIASCMLTVPHMAYKGIAISNAVALIVSFAFLVIRYKQLDRDIKIRVSLGFVSKIVSSSVIAAFAAITFQHECLPYLSKWLPSETVGTLLSLAIGLAVYAAIVKGWKIEEINFVYEKMLAKFRYNKKSSVSARSGG